MNNQEFTVTDQNLAPTNDNLQVLINLQQQIQKQQQFFQQVITQLLLQSQQQQAVIQAVIQALLSQLQQQQVSQQAVIHTLSPQPQQYNLRHSPETSPALEEYRNLFKEHPTSSHPQKMNWSPILGAALIGGAFYALSDKKEKRTNALNGAMTALNLFT